MSLPAGRRADVCRLIDDCKAAGTTVLLNSHLLWEVERSCDRVIVLHGGRVLADGPPAGRAKLFTCLTPLARSAVAPTIGVAQGLGAPEVQPVHLLTRSLSDRDALAAKAVRQLGETDEQIRLALGTGAPAAGGGTDPSALRQVPFSGPAKEALRAALKSALRMGHNYIGTEHLLIGVLSTDEETAQRLAAIGLSRDPVESAPAVELAQAVL